MWWPMYIQDEIPSSRIEQAAMLEGLLIARATGGTADDGIYQYLRREFMAEAALCDLLPPFVRTYRNLSAFWPYIQREAGSYAERREIIGKAFTPLMDFLEGRNSAPGDKVASEALETFDVDGVHSVWGKAIARRGTDPEGAITVARTLLETVTKRILDECGEPVFGQRRFAETVCKRCESIEPRSHATHRRADQSNPGRCYESRQRNWHIA